MDLRTLKKLISLMNENGLVEVELEEEGRKVRLRKGGMPSGGSEPEASARLTAIPEGAASPPAPAPGGAAGEAFEENLVEFSSPMVGTFYRAPSPESAPFVKEGDRVHVGTVLCIIEAMKVMNEIKSEMEGEIVQVLAHNEEAVEFNQPLYLIRALG